MESFQIPYVEDVQVARPGSFPMQLWLHMSADLLGSTAQSTANTVYARHICMPVGNMRGTLEILVFPAWAPFAARKWFPGAQMVSPES